MHSSIAPGCQELDQRGGCDEKEKLAPQLEKSMFLFVPIAQLKMKGCGAEKLVLKIKAVFISQIM